MGKSLLFGSTGMSGCKLYSCVGVGASISSVDIGVGAAVGAAVGVAVGAPVGAAVGVAVGASVLQQLRVTLTDVGQQSPGFPLSSTVCESSPSRFSRILRDRCFGDHQKR